MFPGAQVHVERDLISNDETVYTYEPGIDNPIRLQRDTEDYYYIRDGLGSVTDLVDATGNLVQSYVYDSFGDQRVYDNLGTELTQDQAVKNSYTYTGRVFESETGLYYYRARWYDSGQGRFLSKDAIRIQF